MSKITNDGLTRCGTGGCFIAVPKLQQLGVKGLMIFSYKWRMLTALELHVVISELRFIARTALSIYDTIQEFNVD